MPSIEQRYSSTRFSFSACHFLVGFAKCERLHGHNYNIVLDVKYGMIDSKSILDFRVINNLVQQEVKRLDKKILIPEKSPEIRFLSDLEDRNWKISVKEKIYSFPKQDVQIMSNINTTTCEEIAYYLHQRISKWLKKNFPNLISFLKVKISENLGNKAIYSSTI
ncbi:MAG: 6-pyruvoyl trahydropterin synthase family protein [Candidatus Hodarchaeales archaeon]|jgi:6-pyruvoyltetrahydropterin/6-carboxytetrahydropterin synthase